MNTFIPHKMLALSLNTQAKLSKQILRDKHDAVLSSFILDMKQMLIDKEFIAFDAKLRLFDDEEPFVASGMNELLNRLTMKLKSNALMPVTLYFEECASIVNAISAYLIDIVSAMILE